MDRICRGRAGLLALSGALIALFAALPASAGLLDGWRSGETRRLDEGEFYQSFRTRPAGEARAVAALPVTLDRDIAASFEYGDRVAEFEPLLAAIGARLADGACCVAFDTTGLPADGGPRVYVGSAIGDLAPPDGEELASDADRFPPMVMYLEQPTREWRAAVRERMAAAQLEYILVVNVSVSQYPKGRRGVFAKNVLLGTGHEAPVKFLTAEDKLMEVLQLTGVLLDAEGRVLRAGAEGVLARDTPFTAQIFDVTKMLDDETLKRALNEERRMDLAGQPLAWEVALDILVEGLLH